MHTVPGELFFFLFLGGVFLLICSTEDLSLNVFSKVIGLPCFSKFLQPIKKLFEKIRMVLLDVMQPLRHTRARVFVPPEAVQSNLGRKTHNGPKKKINK